MDKEKFEKYKNATGIALLNAFKNGELTREEYKLIQELKRSGAESIETALSSDLEASAFSESDAKVKSELTAIETEKTEKPIKNKEAPKTPKDTQAKSIKHEQKSTVGLTLKDSLDGPRANYTKFPNAIFDKLASSLEPAEEILYYKLWRLSWGYKRNYCRVGYHELLTTTSIKSRFKVVDGINGLITKGYIARILGPDGKAVTTQSGTLYRVLTPDEVINGITEEGVLISSIPHSGIPMVSIPTIGIPPSSIPNVPSISQPGILEPSIPVSSIPESSIPPEKSHPDSNSGSILDTGIPESSILIFKDILKDTLSLKDIFKEKGDNLITHFYNQIGQSRISNKERERARETYNSLKKEGFIEEEISFAAWWTIQTVKDVRSFTILEHTIGQALSERKNILEQQALENKMETEKQAELERRRLEEEENTELDKHINNLSPAEREALESQARDELIRKEKVEDRYINRMVLSAKVKDILKRENSWR